MGHQVREGRSRKSSRAKADRSTNNLLRWGICQSQCLSKSQVGQKLVELMPLC